MEALRKIRREHQWTGVDIREASVITRTRFLSMRLPATRGNLPKIVLQSS